jgi:ADP-heptose:LPS heptosyltransferase
MSEGPPRILVIRRRYLGDVVLLGPFLQTLRRHWPEARLSVMVDPGFAGILEVNPTVDEVIPFPRGAVPMISLWRRLRSARFTHLFDLD